MGTVRNILFIMCGSALRADYVSCNGHPTLHTPRLEGHSLLLPLLGVTPLSANWTTPFGRRGNGDSGSGGRPVVPEDPRLQEARVVRYHGWTVGGGA
jgi:hypothetical protein